MGIWRLLSYSNCKQQRQAALRNLAPGSLILFGSTLNGNFVLDTVFVVRDSQRYRPDQPPQCDDAFRVCTIQALLTGADCSGDEFTLYRGATYDTQVEGMYSFAPCRRMDCKEPRFARPPISLLADYLDPKSKRNPSKAGIARSVSEVREQWESVRRRVLDDCCLLGISFPTPRLDDGRKDGPR